MSLSELRGRAKETRQWLANIRAELNNFRVEMINDLKQFPEKDEQKKNIYGMVDIAQETIQVIDDLYQAIHTLTLSPPGMASSIIDFLYASLSGTSPKTERQKFREKLQNVSLSIVNQRLKTLDNVMGLREGSVEGLANTIAKEVKLTPSTAFFLKALIETILSNEKPGPAQVQHEVNMIVEQLKKEDAPNAPNKLEALISSLKRRLAELNTSSRSTPQHKQQVIEALQQVKLASLDDGLVKFAIDYKAFTHNLDQWINLWAKRIGQAKQHIRNIEAATGETDKKKVDLVSKYVKFFNSILGEHNPNGVIGELITLRNLAGSTKKALSSAIDTNSISRETLSNGQESEKASPMPVEEKGKENQPDKLALLTRKLTR